MRTAPKTARQGNGNILRSMFAASMSVAAIAAATTGAYFTDSDAPTNSQFATGDVNLALSSTAAIVAKPSNMAPGDVSTGSVTVSNSGSLELRYALKSVTDEDFLAAQLLLTVWTEEAEADTDTICATTAPTTTLYAPAKLGATTTGVKLFGDAAQGPHAGDRVLAANASELLCFRVELPASTGNAYETKTTIATFTFDSEQTVNNGSTTA